MKTATRTIPLLAIVAMGLLLVLLLLPYSLGNARAQEGGGDTPSGASLTVAHFAPFAGEPFGTSVNVLISGTTVVTEMVFGQRVEDIALLSGTYTVEVVPTSALSAATTFTGTAADGQHSEIALIGGANGWPVEAFELLLNTAVPTQGAQLRVTHLAPSAVELASTRIDVCNSDGTAVDGLSGLGYKERSEALILDKGRFEWTVATAGTGCASKLLDLPPFDLREGQVADLYLLGLPGSSTMPLQESVTGLSARVNFAHFAPFAADLYSTTITVRVGVTDIVTDLVFGELTGYLDWPYPLGPTTFELAPTGTVASVLTRTINISGYVDFTTAAIGNGAQPLDFVRLLDDNVSSAPSGKSSIRFTHFAPVDTEVANTKFVVCDAKSGSAVTGDLAYGQSQYVELTAASLDLYAADVGSDCAGGLFDLPTIAPSDGEVAYFYVVGDGVNFEPTAVTLPDLEPETYLLVPIQRQEPKPVYDVMDTLFLDGRFSTLITMLEVAGLDDDLRRPDLVTIFAPTDAAFAKLGNDTLEDLLANQDGALLNLMLYHLLDSRRMTAEFTDGMELASQLGPPLVFSLDTQGRLLVDGVRVVEGDIWATNGAIHVVDDVLSPPD
jgi:uncharacterized surface protein with fasciclin (FAS1) repeats